MKIPAHYTLALVTLLAPLTGQTLAENFSGDELNGRNIERRAVEAVIWGMPAVNYDLMLQEMLSKTKAKENQIVDWGRPLNWMNQTLTPNPDTLYFMGFFNTKDGPMVLEVPPANGGSLNANIVTTWQMPPDDAGRRPLYRPRKEILDGGWKFPEAQPQ